MYFINIIDGMYCVVNSFTGVVVSKFSRLMDATAYIQNMQGLNNVAPQNYGQFFSIPMINHANHCSNNNSCHGSNNNSCSHNNSNNFNNSQINSSIENKIKELSEKVDLVLEDNKEVLEEISILKSILSNSRRSGVSKSEPKRSSKRSHREYNDSTDTLDSQWNDDTYSDEYFEERKPRKEERVSKKEVKVVKTEKPKGKGFRNLMIALASITLVAGVAAGGYFAYIKFFASSNPLGKPVLPKENPRVGEPFFVEIKLKKQEGLSDPEIKVDGPAKGEWTNNYNSTGKSGVVLEVTGSGEVKVDIVYGENTRSFSVTAKEALIAVDVSGIEKEIESKLSKTPYKDKLEAEKAIKDVDLSKKGLKIDTVKQSSSKQKSDLKDDEDETITFAVTLALNDKDKYKFEKESDKGPYNITTTVKKPAQPTSVSTKNVQTQLNESTKDKTFENEDKAIEVIKSTNLDDGLKIKSVALSKNYGTSTKTFDVVIVPIDETFVLASGKDSEKFEVKANITVKPVIVKPEDQTLNEGSTIDLNIEITNPDENTKLTAFSDDENVVKVEVKDKTLKIEAFKEGNANITLSYSGGEDVTFVVKVTKDSTPTPETPVISKIENQSVEVGKELKVKFTVSNPGDGKTTVNSKDLQIATAEIVGKEIVITGIKKGETQITVSHTGALDFTFNVNVTKEDSDADIDGYENELKTVANGPFKSDDEALDKLNKVDIKIYEGIETSKITIKTKSSAETKITTFEVVLTLKEGFKVPENKSLEFDIEANIQEEVKNVAQVEEYEAALNKAVVQPFESEKDALEALEKVKVSDFLGIASSKIEKKVNSTSYDEKQTVIFTATLTLSENFDFPEGKSKPLEISVTIEPNSSGEGSGTDSLKNNKIKVSTYYLFNTYKPTI
ncbi:Ig-like domain-containing protein [Spiroplasma sp. BIUS-1]|uniref:Ig-like domain-containing protein n=1 Tax=Spiroplasma sp. BIUS-1 TaxID=216964 RepID=UPI0013975A95|nr:Ig-like domain-containing protein [Spiroplasma sp. BIUS-1]QHX36793.1 hypothetical protein SBIUS_v1c05400 [Spiroplasma sp. BIUS-1]